MKLLSELYQRILAEGDLETAHILYAVVDGRGGHFQNVKKLREFSPTRIVLQGKRGAVCVEGEGLSLGKYYGGDCTVIGKILRVEREGE